MRNGHDFLSRDYLSAVILLTFKTISAHGLFLIPTGFWRQYIFHFYVNKDKA